jgi:hypothetical protein
MVLLGCFLDKTTVPNATPKKLLTSIVFPCVVIWLG